jgi:beta-lactamase regulating signal transducer with metallopeptidase domain
MTMPDNLAGPMLDAALRGAIVLAGALLITTMLRRRSASLRHAVWAGAIAAQLVLLALAFWGPRWRVAAPAMVTALVPASTGEVAVAPANVRRDASATPVSEPNAPVVDAPANPSAEPPRAVGTPAPAIASAPEPVRRAPSLARVLLAVWAIGVVVVLLRLAAGTVIVARLARRGRRVDDGGWLSLAQRLASALRIDRPLTLMRGDRLGVPVTWGVVYPVVLLPEDADEWPEERRRYVLVHEMAHVKRLDALTQLVGQLALALFWFDPLVWVAVRRMQLEREHACDDYVLRHGIQPSRYAADLLEMVQSLGTPSHRTAQPAFAALAMARRSEFEGRMLSILDPVLDRHPLHRGRTLMSALASLLIIVPLAALQPYRPAPAAAQSATRTSADTTRRTSTTSSSSSSADHSLSTAVTSLDSAVASTSATLDSAGTSAQAGASAKRSSSTTGDDDSCDRFRYGDRDNAQFHIHADDDGAYQTVRYLDFDASHCEQASIAGRIVTTADENGIVALTPVGTARAYFRERTRNADREVTFSYRDGNDARTLTPTYRVNGAEAVYDDAAKRWFADLLPRVLAEAGVNVAPRVARWRVQEGVDGALRHIAELRGSSAKRAHYDVLLKNNQLTGAELDRLVRQAGRDIGSSSDLRAVLSKAAEQQNRTSVPASTLEAAMGAVPSSTDLTAVLLAFSETQDRGQLLAVARTALKIPSSSDLARFLVEVAPRYLERNDAALRDAYFKAVANIPSSSDLSRVLENAVPYATRSPDVARALIVTSENVPSSSDRSRVLVTIAASGAVKGKALRDAYLKSAAGIGGSEDMRHALEALTKATD